MRLFIAVRPKEQVIDEISRYILDVSNRIAGVKWVNGDNLHVTLKFLGDLNFESFKEIEKRLSRSIAKQEQFSLSFKDIGAFPNLNTAKTLWIKALDSGQLVRLSEIIEEDTNDLVRNADMRFHPHLTIGRVKGSPVVFSENRVRDFGCSIIEEVAIIESTLTPKGPIYTDLAKIKLI